MWLLAASLIQIYNGKEQTEKEKTQNVQFEEKRGTRNWSGAKSCTQGNKQIKEKPNAKWKKKEVVTSYLPVVKKN